MDIKNEQKMYSALIMLVFIAVIGSISIWIVKPPAAMDVNAPETVFSSQRALNHLGQIAANPSPIGTDEHEKVRLYLYNQLKNLGLNPEIQKTSVYNPNWRNAGVIHNVLVRIPGTGGSKAVVLAAHYDTVPGVPGAGNGKSGAAALLELARVLKYEQPLHNDIVIMFSDGGEVGMLGATAFLEQHPWAKDVGLVINLGARGTSGPVAVTETARKNNWLIKEFGKAVSRPVANSAVNEINRWIINDTDFFVFKQADIPGLNLMFSEHPRFYQTSLDNLENLDERSLQHQGNYLYSLVKHFGNLELTDHLLPENESADDEAVDNEQATVEGMDRVYFDIWGKFFISYPLTWVAHLLTIVLILCGITCWYGVKNEKTSIKGIALGFAILLAVGFVSTIITSFFTSFARPSHALYQYIPLHNGLWYFAALTALVFGVFVLIYNWALKKFNLFDLVIGGQVLMLLVTIFVSLLLPGISYLFIWPLLFSLTAALVFIFWDKPSWIVRLIILCVSGLPILILWPNILKTLYISIGFGLVGLLIFIKIIVLGLLLPQLRVISHWDQRILPILSLVIVVVCFGVIITGNKVSTDNPQMDSLFVHVDLDNDKAYWASIDKQPDEYTEQAFENQYTEANLSDLIPYEDMSIISKTIDQDTAAGVIIDPITVNVVNEKLNEDSRELTIKINAEEDVNNIIVFIEPEFLVSDVKLNEDVTLVWDEHWPVLRYYNLPAEGITLTVPAVIDEPLKIRVLTQKIGLPKVLQQSIKLRPNYLIPAPTAITDSTFTMQTYQF